MAEREKASELVTLQELAASSAYEIAVIGAVLDQVKRLRDKPGKVR